MITSGSREAARTAIAGIREIVVPSARMAAVSSGEVTRLLASWKQGQAEALDELLTLVYEELRHLAATYLRSERRGHTLQATALVNEACVRLIGKTPVQLEDRHHFFAIAAQAMRRVLVDHARRHRAGKRLGAHEKISLEDAPEISVDPDIDVLAVHEALDRLAEVSPRQAKLVELRFFGGLTNREAAAVLGVSLGTVEREWRVARMWLHRRLSSGEVR